MLHSFMTAAELGQVVPDGDSASLFRLWLMGLNPGVLRTVQKSRLGAILGREAMQFKLESAVTKFLFMPAKPQALAEI
jgi:hypothetical protein